jgi:hypothetical protein
MRNAGVSVIFNKSGKADFAIVLNSVTKPRWVKIPDDGLIKVLQEPRIKNPLTHLFTYRHSRIYDHVYTHHSDGTDPREILSLPLTGTFVNPEEVSSQFVETKTKLVSLIASTLSILPGHKQRTEFISQLLQFRPDLREHTFGRGRASELVRKIDGLREYRYSIAIENTSSPRYVTEKFYDCILAGTVPLYYGAPDIADYFPNESFIALPIHDMPKCLSILSELSEHDYSARVPALLEARDLIRNRYSVGALILSRAKHLPPDNSKHSSVHNLFRLDGILTQCQRLGVTVLPRRTLAIVLATVRKNIAVVRATALKFRNF